MKLHILPKLMLFSLVIHPPISAHPKSHLLNFCTYTLSAPLKTQHGAQAPISAPNPIFSNIRFSSIRARQGIGLSIVLALLLSTYIKVQAQPHNRLSCTPTGQIVHQAASEAAKAITIAIEITTKAILELSKVTESAVAALRQEKIAVNATAKTPAKANVEYTIAKLFSVLEAATEAQAFLAEALVKISAAKEEVTSARQQAIPCVAPFTAVTEALKSITVALTKIKDTQTAADAALATAKQTALVSAETQAKAATKMTAILAQEMFTTAVKATMTVTTAVNATITATTTITATFTDRKNS